MISLTSPVKTWAHAWPAGGKLAALCIGTVALFWVDSLIAHSIIAALVLLTYALPGRRFFLDGLSKLWGLWPFLAIVAIWHVIDGSLTQGLVIILRMLSAVACANLVTMTTRLSDMIAVVRFISSPLRALGLRTRPLEVAIALVIRMTPVMLEKGTSLAQSWRARSPRRASWRIVLPFTVLALDDADYVADALKARGGITPTEDM